MEERLQGEKAPKLLAAIDQKAAERWKDGLSGSDRARTALAGGRLEYGPTADGGWRVHAWLPWTA